MAVVVLAEYHVDEVLLVVYERQGVELVVPDDVVCRLEAGVSRSGDELVERGHEFLDLDVAAHAGNAVVAAGDNAEQLPVSGTVIGNGDSRMPCFFFEFKNIRKRCIGFDI